MTYAPSSPNGPGGDDSHRAAGPVRRAEIHLHVALLEREADVDAGLIVTGKPADPVVTAEHVVTGLAQSTEPRRPGVRAVRSDDPHDLAVDAVRDGQCIHG
ncbi:hypothetical protein RE0356_14780 [Prescottella equi]|nr:hypothetical protein RE0356_14780 [Prescottella equi]